MIFIVKYSNKRTLTMIGGVGVDDVAKYMCSILVVQCYVRVFVMVKWCLCFS